MKKIQINIDWGMVFWIGIITVFLWLIAKAVGLINTPLILEILPYIGGFAAILGGIREIGRFIHKVENGLNNIKELTIGVDKIDTTTNSIKLDIHNLDKRVTILEKILSIISKKFSI